MYADRLYEKVLKHKNPSVLGLDPLYEYVPASIKCKTATVAEAIYQFNQLLIDSLSDIIGIVKCQSAYYEALGPEGAISLKKTMDYAKMSNMIVILDCKRNDIGSTAEAYASAYLDSGQYNADCITVNGYLGSDGITPFVKRCVELGKGIYVLVKTSNKSSFELQDLKLDCGLYVYEQMAELVKEWGNSTIGKYGYSSIGAVVGATFPVQLAALRKRMKHTPFLVPGFGAQGGNASDTKEAFDNIGNGAIINSSRGLMCAWQKQGLHHEQFAEAAVKEAMNMKNELSMQIN